MFLVPTLHDELKRLTDPPPEVYLFTNIPDGIKAFSKATGAKADKLPPPERVEVIKKEQNELPPLGWIQNNDAASIAIHNAQMRHRRAAFLASIAGEGSAVAGGRSHFSE